MKISQLHALPVDGNLRDPSFVSDQVADTQQPRSLVRRIWAPLVLKIRTSIDIAQVGDAVVGSDTVDMVDVCCRPYTMSDKPCQPVTKKYVAVDPDSDVALIAAIASNRPSLLLPPLLTPDEQPSFGIVVKVCGLAYFKRFPLHYQA